MTSDTNTKPRTRCEKLQESELDKVGAGATATSFQSNPRGDAPIRSTGTPVKFDIDLAAP